jgi:hypothetical protein
VKKISETFNQHKKNGGNRISGKEQHIQQHKGMKINTILQQLKSQ